MRQDAVTLERFYASPLGSAAARILSTKVIDLWGDANNLSLLGLGYALPVLDAFGVHPGRSVAAVPFDHGPVRWDPTGRGNATVSVGDLRLPFPDGMFDRVIVLHGLEETGDPRAYLREIWRVMAPEGRIILAGPTVEPGAAYEPDVYWTVPGDCKLKRALHATAIDRDRDRSGGGMGCHRAPDYPRPWRRRHGRSGEAALCVTRRWNRSWTGCAWPSQ